MLKIASPFSGVTPIPEAPANVGLSVGDSLDFVGFGETESGSYGSRLHAVGQLDGFGCVADCGCPSNNNYQAIEICYDQEVNGPCFGDSGGPAFVTRGSQWYVAGMTSYGDSYCTLYGVSTRADAFESFIHGFAGAN
jgi:hypothetical protein